MYSPVTLYAPWTVGQVWHAGGNGSYYGDGYHTDAYNSYYAVDFNKGQWPNNENDDGEPVLAAADGTVNRILNDDSTGGAWVVEIYHTYAGGTVRTQYWHLEV